MWVNICVNRVSFVFLFAFQHPSKSLKVSSSDQAPCLTVLFQSDKIASFLLKEKGGFDYRSLGSVVLQICNIRYF